MELLLTLLIVTFLSFLLVKLSPVDAAEAYARRTFMLYTPEQLDALREKMGLNQPLLVQYGTWIRNALHLDFGTSLVNGRSVFGEVSRAMGVTLSIVLIAAAIEVVGILLVGSLCYWCRRKWIISKERNINHEKETDFSAFSGALPLHGVECLRRAYQ